MIAIDSNAFAYFVQAWNGEYDPAVDTSDLKVERVAVVRIFLFGKESYYVPPTVETEHKRITDPVLQGVFEEFQSRIFEDPWNLEPISLNSRADELNKSHSGRNDCVLVAECEQMGIETLLTVDKKLIKHLSAKTSVDVCKPSDYWDRMNISKGATPVTQPASRNPLAKASWWRW